MIKEIELKEKVEEKKLFISHHNGIYTEVPNNKGIYVNGSLAAIVSNKYKLVKNEELLDRLNDWSESHGFDLHYQKDIATRRWGNNIHQNWFPFTIGDGFKVKNDQDEEKTHYCVAEVFNSYDGKMSWGTNVSGEIIGKKMMFYVWRLVCSNGMWGWKAIGEKAWEKEEGDKHKKEVEYIERVAAEGRKFKHVGDFDMQFDKIISAIESQDIVKEHLEKIYQIHSKTFIEVFLKYLPIRMAKEVEMLFNGLQAFQAIQAITYYAKTKYQSNRIKYEKIQTALNRTINKEI